MYKEILRSMEGVEVGAVVGFLIFFTFFLVMIIYLFTLKKSYRDDMKNIPLD